MNRPEPIAVFRTAAHDAFVTLHAGDDGTHAVTCTGCGLHLGPEVCDRKSAEEFANTHAGLCYRMPPQRWPEELRP